MLFGSHVSIAGGAFNAPINAAAEGCEVFQMFTRSPRGGAAPKLTPDVVKQFKAACAEHGFKQYYVHAPYYVNLASSQAATYNASIKIIREELERGSLLGVEALMIHIGSAKDLDRPQALDKAIAGLKKILAGYTGSTQLLLELSAGSGNVIGNTFEELAFILKQLKSSVGICLDTCHAFASGYDLRTKTGVETTLKDFDKTIGLSRLKLLHLNDSKKELGSHVDRHEHIGQGEIGLAGFKALISHPKLKKINGILETHKDGNWPAKNLKILKDLRQ